MRDNLENQIRQIENLLYLLKKEVRFKSALQNESKYIKVREAAKITGYKETYIYELIKHNKIPYIKINRSIRFDRDILEEWIRGK